MYSVILATLLTTGSPEMLGHHGRSCGGYNAFSCSCSCYGCSGCHGCYGCSGCYGYSSSWCGCSGCWGCSGCSGCWGCHGCWGSYVSPWASYTVGYTYWGAGCYGSWCTCSGSGWSWCSCIGGTSYASPGYIVVGPSGSTSTGSTPSSNPPASSATAPPPNRLGSGGSTTSDPATTPTNPAEADAVRRTLKDLRSGKPAPPPPPPPGELKLPGQGFGAVDGSKARIVVRLSDNAQLWVNDVKCPLSGAVRSFETPDLQPGGQYFYTLTVELPQGGRENRRVALTPGEITEVDFRPMANAMLQTARP